ncbi:MAG TPA: DUF2279 domain-containing protein, partial [Thermoanaerobaculia bacterium]|nr:DUF2279 domain-containing protein [Thermoanaerobaculia bacterium]
EAATWSLFSRSTNAFAMANPGFNLLRSSDELRDCFPSGAAPFRETPPAPAASRRLFDTKTILATGGILLSVATASYSKWWSGRSTSFHFRREGLFGRDTYAGGLDKASHFWFAYMSFEPFERFFRLLDHPATESGMLALGTVIGTGVVVESGDGFGTGASWEDLGADILGGLTAFALRETRLDDTVGFRAGWLPTQPTPGVYRRGPSGSDYSQELYSADLKLGGLFRRLRLSPGVSRFLLLSMTYDTKGYGVVTVPPQSRERNVGVALGLNLPEIARALGLREDSWWSRPLYGFLSYFRIPYTAFGFRYDLNHHRWQGPDTGDRYHPDTAP